jgi:hypothetical protein
VFAATPLSLYFRVLNVTNQSDLVAVWCRSFGSIFYNRAVLTASLVTSSKTTTRTISPEKIIIPFLALMGRAFPPVRERLGKDLNIRRLHDKFCHKGQNPDLCCTFLRGPLCGTFLLLICLTSMSAHKKLRALNGTKSAPIDA